MCVYSTLIDEPLMVTAVVLVQIFGFCTQL